MTKAMTKEDLVNHLYLLRPVPNKRTRKLIDELALELIGESWVWSKQWYVTRPEKKEKV